MLIKGYSDLSITPAGVMPSVEPLRSYGAHFRLDNNVSLLFPYIKTDISDTFYFDSPEYVQFMFKNVKCSLYPDEVIAVPFDGENSARLFAEALIVYLNELEARKNSLKPDHRRFQSISVPDLFRLLPGTNCGECGFSACMAFAAHLSIGEASPSSCPGFVKPIRETAVYPVFDKDGTLTSTISIEVELSNSNPPAGQLKTPVRISSTGVQAELTSREREVLCLVAEGITNRDIADRLFISHHTVKSHVVHIFNKLGVNDRTQAAVWAAKNKII